MGGPPELTLEEATATGEWGVSDAGQRGEEETLFDNVAARGIFARDESPLEMSPTAMTSPTTTPPTTPPNSYLTPPHCPLVAAPRPHTSPLSLFIPVEVDLIERRRERERIE